MESEYTFQGWSKTAKGGVQYKNKSSVTSLTATNGGTTKLYAQWGFKVTYKKNAADAQGNDVAYTYIKGYAGSTAVPCGYIRQGYQFDSWNTKADGSGKSYAAGSYIGDLKPGTVLYAQWSYSYMAKVNEFINIPEYQNGKIWNDNTYNKMSSWSSSGCCAYAYDFAKYVYGIDGDLNKAASWISSSPTEIQTGDIIYSSTKGHWFVVLERTGNTLYTAEGNVSGKVRICNDVYSITETGSINDKWNGDFGGLTIYHFNF